MRAYLEQTISQADSFDDVYAAEVWLVDMSLRLERFIRNPEDRLKLLKVVHRESSRVGLQPELILAVIHTESTFNRFAVSSAGAQGLMQIMPFWRRELGREDDNLIELETNIRYGTTILSYYLKREKGNLSRALARYNGSLGKTWYPERVMTRWERFWVVN
ncbi:lytic transglycosylase domain-containing protein [Sansalvadorimonas verongulae]|uniref:lytic transglycosylase domain-containing protein n=1 Tax=Sansalvadorimonas verongulae TaxID=2172824 RepID=UPI0012BB73FE|nr:lytic transglycosylase domain-containing protein [Sansalvadorimonas verongulae]MTI14769.1 lytic transglycosylase domain-containing protein [Sansalvadorimonas verongulae]